MDERTASPTTTSSSATSGEPAASVDRVANQAVMALDKAGAKGEELIDASAGYMREHPVFTLGIAVTAGYVLSRLLTSR